MKTAIAICKSDLITDLNLSQASIYNCNKSFWYSFLVRESVLLYGPSLCLNYLMLDLISRYFVYRYNIFERKTY